MPLSEKARIEVYLPDIPTPAYQDLLTALDREFTFSFGGCTTIRGLDGSYLSHRGQQIRDRVSLIYCDLPFAFEDNRRRIARYADRLRDAAFQALAEEAILVAVLEVHHAETLVAL